jgi:hypothetical protein
MEYPPTWTCQRGGTIGAAVPDRLVAFAQAIMDVDGGQQLVEG